MAQYGGYGGSMVGLVPGWWYCWLVVWWVLSAGWLGRWLVDVLTGWLYCWLTGLMTDPLKRQRWVHQRLLLLQQPR